jgi:hypothetical protein
MEKIHGSSGTEPQQVASRPPPIDVRDEAGLISALNPECWSHDSGQAQDVP